MKCSKLVTYLYDIQTGSSCTSHIDCDRLYKGTFCKILNLFRHGSTEEKGLSLSLKEKENHRWQISNDGQFALLMPHCKNSASRSGHRINFTGFASLNKCRPTFVLGKQFRTLRISSFISEK